MSQRLKGLILIERESLDGHLHVAWQFPSLSGAQSKLTLDRCKQFLCNPDIDLTFAYFRLGVNWQYILWTDHTISRDVNGFGISILTSEFNPSAYRSILEEFSKLYASKKEPTCMLDEYLQLFTGQMRFSKYGNFDSRVELIQPGGSKERYIVDIISDLGADWILLYTAILLKRKVVVVHENLEYLLNCVCMMTHLCWHRRIELLANNHPLVGVGKLESTHLSKSPYFIAGFTDLKQAKQDYDVLLNLNSKSIEISNDSVRDFALCKFQKEIAVKVLEGVKRKPDSQGLIKISNTETQNLLKKLNMLKTAKHITRDELEEKGFAEKTFRFLLNLCIAEGILQ